MLSARPYAYLDDAPLEERRTQAVMARRWLAPEAAADIGRLDPEAIARVQAEAWPEAANADELHDGLVWLGFLTAEEARGQSRLERLAVRACRSETSGRAPGCAACRRSGSPPSDCREFQAALAGRQSSTPPIAAPTTDASTRWSRDEALVEIVRGRLEGQGPVSARTHLRVARGWRPAEIAGALAALETEGFALRGRFTARMRAAEEWCERRLLARIHHYTVKRLRAEIEPVAARDFLRFLPVWQRMTAETRMEGPQALDGSWRSSKASRLLPAPGKARSCRPGSPAYEPPGSTTAALPAVSPGRGCGRAMRAEIVANGGATGAWSPARAHHTHHAPARDATRRSGRRFGKADAPVPAPGRRPSRIYSPARRLVL